jgi:hypothetical protein
MLERIRTDGFIDPCIPTLAAKPPSGPGWVHEIKHDGYRLIVRRDSPASGGRGRGRGQPRKRLSQQSQQRAPSRVAQFLGVQQQRGARQSSRQRSRQHAGGRRMGAARGVFASTGAGQ